MSNSSLRIPLLTYTYPYTDTHTLKTIVLLTRGNGLGFAFISEIYLWSLNKDNLILKSVKWFKSSGPIMFVAHVFQTQLLQVLVMCMLPWHRL